jgi:hypothetical protein
VCLRLGRPDEAARHFCEAGKYGAEVAHTETLWYALEGIAAVCEARGRDLAAARLWGAAEAMRDSAGYLLQQAELDVHDEAVPRARERAGADAFDRAWAEGRALSGEQALAEALDLEQ